MPRAKKPPPPPVPDDLLTWQQVQAACGMGRNQMYKLTNSGVLGYVEVNRRVGRLVRRSTLESYLKSIHVHGEH